MRCGAKCFQVHMESDNKRNICYVDARTPADARKIIKRHYGEKVEILSAIQHKN